MKITPKKIKSQEKIVYLVEIDDYTKECHHSKEAAESKLKELQEKKIAREKDFLIAEKLFDYKWINFCDHNYLVHPKILNERSWMSKDEKKFLPGKYISGIFTISMSDENWQPPDFEKSEYFLSLYTKLTELGLVVWFSIDKDEITCHIDKDSKLLLNYKSLRKKDYWSNEYLMKLALKSAAYLYCKSKYETL